MVRTQSEGTKCPEAGGSFSTPPGTPGMGLAPTLQHSLEKAKGTKSDCPADKDQHGQERAPLQESQSSHSCTVLSGIHIFRNSAKLKIIKWTSSLLILK